MTFRKNSSTPPPASRRDFLQTAGATAAGLALSSPAAFSQEKSTAYPLKGRLFKTLKIGMVKLKDSSLTDRFKLAKEAGFGAIELSCPGSNVDEVNQAVEESGLPVDGSVCAAHWGVRHTDPDPKVREEALKNLLGALKETKAVGGSTVLLVVGHGKDGAEAEIWDRSVENISKALPLAAELGVSIAIENVWNHFCYDHEGDVTQTADKFVKYVDDFNSPFVGMQFDIGNHWKYGPTGDWIRALGKRIIKLDVKGFSRAENKFTKIGEGDLDFADVRKALTDINFYGWCAAEVGGGGLDRLKEVSDNMDREFGLA
ncbi:MAG: sugar phosphate isomerase/epimerase [Verrucomicrobiales bacterium]|nr:sugar phosphate isomerase/epimerase [Verrucomicrobiales bacterium]